jgi:trans-aconitate methyltransferase
VIINTSKLRKSYTVKDMEYLDSDEAEILYRTKADIIKKYNLSGIVDVGCRIGTVNKYLNNYNYQYYGFDTSLEPIDVAQKMYPTQKFEVRSWDNLIKTEFTVDVLIFGSVLIYEDNPIAMFERISKFYNPKFAIVHEVNNKNKEDLKYTDLSYFLNNYKCDVYEFDLNIPCGKRTILNVEYR